MAVVLDNSADSLFLAGNHSLVPQVNSCWVKTKRLLSSSIINLPDSIYKLANTSSVPWMPLQLQNGITETNDRIIG